MQKSWQRSDFTIGDEGTEARISIDYTNSKITRSNTDQTMEYFQLLVLDKGFLALPFPSLQRAPSLSCLLLHRDHRFLEIDQPHT